MVNPKQAWTAVQSLLGTSRLQRHAEILELAEVPGPVQLYATQGERNLLMEQYTDLQTHGSSLLSADPPPLHTKNPASLLVCKHIDVKFLWFGAYLYNWQLSCTEQQEAQK